MDEKQDSPFTRQKPESILRTDSVSNRCPSLHRHKSNPLHYRRLLLLSIRCGYIRKLVDGFLSRLFLLSRMLNEQKKHLQIRHLGMVVTAACLRIVKTCEDRSVVNHCVQVRRTFKILDIEEWIRTELKKGARRKHGSEWKTRLIIFETKKRPFFAPTLSRTHAPRFTAAGLFPWATDACYCCLLNRLHTKNIGRKLSDSLVSSKLCA